MPAWKKVITSGSDASLNTLQLTNLGSQNETLIVGTANQVTSSNILSLDTTNNRVGIGTASPAYQVEIENTGANALLVLQRTDGASCFIEGQSARSAFGSVGATPLALAYNSLAVVTIGENGAITVNPDGDGFTFPTTDGSANQVLQTNGSGVLSFADVIDATNGVNNRLATFTDSNSLNGEANLTFDGSVLGVTGRINTSLTITGSSAQLNSVPAGTDNTVLIIDNNGNVLRDEIDPRVWGSTLVDGSNGADNRIATFTDTNSLNGEENFTYDGTTVTVTSGNVDIGRSLAVGGITPSGTTGRIDASNDVVAYSSSDKRWKTNIKPIQSPIEKLQKLSGVEFDWIEDTEIHGNVGNDVGVIAQEVELVLPQAVQTRDSGMKAVRYEKLIPLLIETIKEQQKQIDELKNKIG